MDANVNKKIFLEKRYIESLLKWNKMETGINTHKYDIKFVRLLLMVAVGATNLICGEIHIAVSDFIKEMFKIRTGSNLIRLLQLDKIIEIYVAELREKAKKKAEQDTME